MTGAMSTRPDQDPRVRHDHAARMRALDSTRSFIVQAPAGSGKTELLIQRILVLLACVERPEQILAITFTRKAAGEMKKRVLDALAKARSAASLDPNARSAASLDSGACSAAEDASAASGTHQALTRMHALRALERDRELGWRIEENPSRLRILTIDALCASLTRQMPVLARFGAQPGVVEDARELYREAARRTFSALEGGDEATSRTVAQLLEHLDNNVKTAEALLADMLGKRDQWLRRTGVAPDRKTLEAALRAERHRVMADARARIPSGLVPELLELACYAGYHVRDVKPDSPIVACDGMKELPVVMEAAAAGDDVEVEAECGEGANGGDGATGWLAIAELLLTAKGGWRSEKGLTKNVGFPAGTSKTEKETAKSWKARHAALTARLAEVADAERALHALRSMPAATYTETEWQALGAIVALLPRAAAELKLVFAARGEVDFTEMSQGAVLALGDADAPTDLMLSLDVRLSHILVDEFQDTSISQFELLAGLTAGWQGHSGDDEQNRAMSDGRTLFLVGDPMQSIYRFREAEVGLFLRARREGLGLVKLEPLTLSTNFRSQAGVVDWVNEAFSRIIPAAAGGTTVPSTADETEMVQGPAHEAVSYTPSAPHRERLAGDAVHWHAFFHRDNDGRNAAREAEAARVVQLVLDARERNAGGSTAILVRSRGHLDRIVPALKAARLRFRAIDIERLDEKQVVQDLLALTRALSHPADRIAWLSCLRAPWCGLTLADLLVVADTHVAPRCAEEVPEDALSMGISNDFPDSAGALGQTGTIWECLHDESLLVRLSADGRTRLDRVRAVLDTALAQRLRGALRDRVEGVWLALGGPACVENATELEDAEMFLDTLDAAETAGDIDDPAALREKLDELYALPDLDADDSLCIMTIHKAKGLEFDTVIVPGLDRSPRAPDSPLLQWKMRAAAQGGLGLLLAPVRETGERGNGKAHSIYRYLSSLERQAEDAEGGRLLYVAATRAKSQLHWLATVRLASGDEAASAPAPRSLLGKAWTVAEAGIARLLASADAAVSGKEGLSVVLPQAPEASDAGTLRRLSATWNLPTVPDAATWPGRTAIDGRRADGADIEFAWVGETARHVGTVVHRWLQRVVEEGLDAWNAARVQSLQAAFRGELVAQGVEAADLAGAVQRVVVALASALADDRGRWLLGARQQARNEFRLSMAVDGERRNLVIDRTFIDDGQRWIVDYKTGSHEGGDVERFLDEEQKRYAAQLQRYARAMAQAPASATEGTAAPKLGLYFPMLSGWREWESPGESGSGDT